jgi:hypothetical protein
MCSIRITGAATVTRQSGAPGKVALGATLRPQPQPLGSDQPTARQLDPGLGLTAPPPITFVPFISQTEAWPLAF